MAALLVDVHLDQIGRNAPRIRNEFITDLLEHISGYLGVGDSKEQKEEKKEEKKKGSFR